MGFFSYGLWVKLMCSGNRQSEYYMAVYVMMWYIPCSLYLGILCG